MGWPASWIDRWSSSTEARRLATACSRRSASTLAERLIESGEAEEIAARHLEFFAELAETAAPELRGPTMVDSLDRLDSEIENLGAALEWSLESDPDTAVRMCSAMLAYWRSRTPSPDNQDRIVASVEAARRIVAGPPDATTAQRVAAARLLGLAAWLMVTSRPR